MTERDKRIDAYITKAPAFAKPILTHLRELVHKGCPGATETIKHGIPHFMYSGEILCSMSYLLTFYCSFGFRKAYLMRDPHNLLITKKMSTNLGMIKSKEALPPDKIMISYIKEAARLNKEKIGITDNLEEKEKINVPGYLKSALAKNKKAANAFKNSMNNTAKKIFIDWIISSENEKIRNHRIATAIKWISEGTVQYRKYQ